VTNVLVTRPAAVLAEIVTVMCRFLALVGTRQTACAALSAKNVLTSGTTRCRTVARAVTLAVSTACALSLRRSVTV
jgi:hypothetical protein